nr:immunoglobulin light chain junction region [Macaca mulatta]MOX82228.1 immunoglobulin light chain junction region [Macaca mulatta]MOX83670.1 immunoglobulin light chain junction region [Macaca mulatta]MOX83958.1 immunoglobulin light chain junction region [Macaca mulatta]
DYYCALWHGSASALF